jgi:hypothetical protein
MHHIATAFGSFVSHSLLSSLSVIYAILGCHGPGGSSSRNAVYLQRSNLLLGHVIQRKIMKHQQEGSSRFWSIFKLAVLNNLICVSRELSMDVEKHLFAMECVLVQHFAGKQVDSVDLKHFSRTLQVLRRGEASVAAVAA